jgi:hypothetical protein
MDPTKRESIMQGINRFVVYQDRLNITEMVLDMVNRGTPTPNDGMAKRPGPPIPPR